MPKHYIYARFYESTSAAIIGFERIIKEDLKWLCTTIFTSDPVFTIKRKDLKVIIDYPSGMKETHCFIGRREYEDWYRQHLCGLQLSGWCVVGGMWSADEINYFNCRCRIRDGVEIK